ncbi:proteoglycan 4-like [Uloborus diversus]|uniref:proteoglycan 4-like n=1 Tax=Uloborus diversus TaxID=327109 RepID=UPI00240A16C9|nr:proteoglycan 4-like [Uloborus diversus]
MVENRLVLCLCCYFVLGGVLGQDVTNSLTETVTESSDWTRSHPVDWDTHSTATIPDTNQGTLFQNEAYSSLTDEWKSYLISQTPFGARLSQNRQPETENPRSDVQNTGTEILNLTLPEETYQQLSRSPIESPVLSYPYTQFFYPSMYHLEPSGLTNHPFSSLSRTPNYSAPFVNPLFYDTAGREPEYLPTGNFPFPAYYFPSAQNLRDVENAALPTAYPVPNFYYPYYPTASNSNEKVNSPTINVFVRPPFTNQEGSSAAQEENAAALSYQPSKPIESNSQKEIRPAEVPVSEESFPLESLPPAQSIPYGEFPLPFGIFPQGMFPPAPIFNTDALPPVVQEIPPQRFQEIPPQRFQEIPPQRFQEIPPQRFQEIPQQKLPNTPVLPAEEIPANPVPAVANLETEEVPSESFPSTIPLESVAPKEVPIPLIPKTQEQIDNSQYGFGFLMNDGNGSGQSRQEISNGDGTVKGRYSYTDPFGMYRVVNYVADRNGFRAVVHSNEPGVANPGSADVMVIAEPPPPHALAEGAKKPELIPIIVPDEPVDLTAQGSELKDQISKR